MIKRFKFIVERHENGYVAYPLGLQGHFLSQGATYQEALENVKSLILFHIKTFGAEVVEIDSPVLDAFVAEETVTI